MKTVCIIQTRMGSTRLPGKVLLDLAGKTVLQHVIERVARAKRIDAIIIATTNLKADDAIVNAVEGYQCEKPLDVYRGSENDVLDRYYQAAKLFHADVVVRVTSDCPAIDPEIIDKVMDALSEDAPLDYAANILQPRTFPRGLDVECARFAALERSWKESSDPFEREHVTLHIRMHPESYQMRNVVNVYDASAYRWTLDEEADYRLLTEMFNQLYPVTPMFTLADALALFAAHPGLAALNRDVVQKHKEH